MKPVGEYGNWVDENEQNIIASNQYVTKKSHVIHVVRQGLKHGRTERKNPIRGGPDRRIFRALEWAHHPAGQFKNNIVVSPVPRKYSDP